MTEKEKYLNKRYRFIGDKDNSNYYLDDKTADLYVYHIDTDCIGKIESSDFNPILGCQSREKLFQTQHVDVGTYFGDLDLGGFKPHGK